MPCPRGFPSPSRSPIGEPNLIQIKTKRIRRGLLLAWEMRPPPQTKGEPCPDQGTCPAQQCRRGLPRLTLSVASGSPDCPASSARAAASGYWLLWKAGRGSEQVKEQPGARVSQGPLSCPAAAKAKGLQGPHHSLPHRNVIVAGIPCKLPSLPSASSMP